MNGPRIALALGALMAASVLFTQPGFSQDAKAPDGQVSAVIVEGRKKGDENVNVPGRLLNLGRMPVCESVSFQEMCERTEDASGILRNGYALYEAGDQEGALKEFNTLSWMNAEYGLGLSKGVDGSQATVTTWLGRAEGDGAHQLRYAHGAIQLTQEASLMNAEILLNGIPELADGSRGVAWLQRIARSGTRVQAPTFDAARPYTFRSMPQIAAVWLGTLYRQGDKVERDLILSRAWYERAAKLGYVPAYKALGDIYATGLGVPKDGRKAAAYYRKAADYGFAPAQTALAALYEAGAPGLAADKGKALALYQQAANSDADAIYTLALAYEAGDGVTADPAHAIELYRRAAEMGDRRARAAYGLHLYEGTGVARDHVQARRWLEQAAAAGEPEAIYNLGVMMARGEGGARDLSKAWVLFTFSRIGGQTQAAQALAALEQRMSPEERASAAAMLPAAPAAPQS